MPQKASTAFFNSTQGWFSERVATWAARRQGVDSNPVTLHRRRVYILPTRQGWLYGVSVFAMLIASLNYNNNLGLLLSFLLSGTGIAAIFRCQRNLAGMTIHIQPAAPAFAGSELRFPVLLHHDNHQRLAIEGGVVPVNVSAEQDVVTHIARKARKRGHQRLDRFSLFTTFPLGLFRAWVWVDADVTSLVWPRPAAAPAQSTSKPAPEAASGSAAEGDDDFAGLRNWRRGDPIKRVDWHALARERGLFTKQFTTGASAPDYFDLDALTALPLEQALSRLTRSILNAHAKNTAYGLRLDEHILPPDSGHAHRDRCLSALALYKP